mmetsp:Transcript_30806/g.53527  ORF Transcript_30806/g.53527 Transcript_30806/m.53527 type:complete len:85 (-) Transcript_30806:1364-1618(-)
MSYWNQLNLNPCTASITNDVDSTVASQNAHQRNILTEYSEMTKVIVNLESKISIVKAIVVAIAPTPIAITIVICIKTSRFLVLT